ncbi:MAG: C-GCAxxG-C-C family (seleno)protein [Clostridia bacterium]
MGAAEGLFGTMAEEVGYPFDHIPTEAFINAAGGYQVYSICGTLGVASAFIGTVADADTQKKVVKELMAWYKTAEMPIYQPEAELDQTVSNSVICENSVGEYMAESGTGMGDKARKQRCAGVAADVTRKTFELLSENL